MSPAEIKLQRCSLLTVKADVCICPVHRSKNLNTYKISRRLLQASGESVQIELQQTSKDDMKCGDVQMAEPGRLQNFKKIMFICLGSYVDGHEQVLHQSLQECMELVAVMGFTSIAMPALGTGGLKFPAHKVARATVDAVALHNLQYHDQSSLQTVNVVLLDQDVELIKTYLKICTSGSVEESNPDMKQTEASTSGQSDASGTVNNDANWRRKSATPSSWKNTSSAQPKKSNGAVGLTNILRSFMRPFTFSWTVLEFTVYPSMNKNSIGVGLHVGVNISFLKSFIPPGLFDFFQNLG